jgi:hypothetical protein
MTDFILTDQAKPKPAYPDLFPVCILFVVVAHVAAS